jgi:hypothetical protein
LLLDTGGEGVLSKLKKIGGGIGISMKEEKAAMMFAYLDSQAELVTDDEVTVHMPFFSANCCQCLLCMLSWLSGFL